MNEIIDLTYSINEKMITYPSPWHPKVSLERLGKIEDVGRNTRKLVLGTHTGTHIDAPLHFIPDGNSIESIPLEKITGTVTILDFTNLKNNHPITKEELQDKKISKRLIFRFGWQKYWNTPNFYNDYPFFTEDAANYLVSQGVELIGYDTPSPDKSKQDDVDSPIHKIFLSNQIVLLEYLSNLDCVQNLEGWSIVVAPMKIDGSDGSPSRVFIFK
ncbi:cyclase family protein [Nitrosopumilus maritimus]|uniref:Cyclase family protein n=1 Tax=Nitrosopumilus maritimus (strain SCM1) TaxID=436308 RepID=A9A1S1_NITMS|nr:cyclase family protein [Nitrosopumilus maritimus]ABX12042.1 cyclase family protein [Nitrosopumilus maritimus SCM1]